MAKYKNFFEAISEELRRGEKYPNKFLKDGKNPLREAIKISRGYGISEETLRKAIDVGMIDGSFEMTYEGAQRIYDTIKKIVKDADIKNNHDYQAIFDSLDPVTDYDLIVAGMFSLIPEVREKVANKVDNLYRVILNVAADQRKGYALPVKEKLEGKSIEEGTLSPKLEQLLLAIPRAETKEQEEDQRRLRVLLHKKAEREIFPLFKKKKDHAFKVLEKKIAEVKNENLREEYIRLKEIYSDYSNFNIVGANPDFRDPNTGEMGVLPSLHQKIAIYHLLKEKRFGVFDGCGTGKTAIAILAQPLIENEIAKCDGGEFKRIVIVCPNTAKKAWKKGLEGDETERYLKNKQDIAVINGERKDGNLLSGLRNKRWIILNYEQLITKVNGSRKSFAEELVDMGFDYLIFDENHHIKSQRKKTKTGKPTLSAAARYLAHNSEYVCLLTGSPIPDKLEDYAVPCHILNPSLCPEPEKFNKLYNNNPRILYTIFDEKTIRRNIGDINDELEWDESEAVVKLDDIQRRLYDHIVTYKPKNWLLQARKALLDPRLVDPEVLKRAGLLGSVSIKNSAKYRKLEEILTSRDGPLRNLGNPELYEDAHPHIEKFVIFSSMFRDGVTQKGNASLKKRYDQIDLSEEYEKLQLDISLDAMLEKALRETYGRDLKLGVIDGTITDVIERERIVSNLKNGLVGILCTTDTGGESLDFTSASYAIFLDEDYCPKTEEQALARLIRKGQRKKVNVIHLRAKDTLDEKLEYYVDKKRIINKIATDGHPLTEEERKLLEDTKGKTFADIIQRGLGGHSINVLDALVDDTSCFTVKKRAIGPSRTNFYDSEDSNITEAQKLMRWIGQDPINCWKNPEFVELYMDVFKNLSVPITHRAKICDLLNRANSGEIAFPTKILSEGSGPSIVYGAYQDLSEIIRKNGYDVPFVVDRDTSLLMLQKGNNPNKILGCMTGRDSAFEEETFDMVDNGSISLLRNPDEVKSSLIEASRILKLNGLIELTVQNMKFSNGFYSGMGKIGFELLSTKNEGFSVSRQFYRKLKDEHGEHFANAYANKIAETYLILGRKKDNPAETNAEDFWFEKGADEDEKEDKKEEIKSELRIKHTESYKYDRRRKRSSKNNMGKIIRKALPDEVPRLRQELQNRKITIEE